MANRAEPNMNDRTVEVLLVDDDHDEYLLTRPLVESCAPAKLRLSWAADRDEMLEHISRKRVDVILMDYHLGAENGVDLIQELMEAGSEIPFVLLTGVANRAIDIEAMEGGAVDFLDKDGLTSLVLERSIRYAVERARLQTSEREANYLYRSLVEHIPAAFFISDAFNYARKSYVSPQMVSLLDIDDNDETPWLDHIHIEHREAVAAHIAHSDLTGASPSISYQLHKRDDSLAWVHEEAVLVRNESGDPVHWHGVIYDITAQKRAEAQLYEGKAELKNSNDALERSNRALQEFVYVASHDLKAPLVSIMGMATLLQQDLRGSLDGDPRTYLDRIVANAAKMRQLLEDILELSRVGSDEARSEPTDLDSVVTDVRDQLRHQLESRSATVTVDGPLPSVTVNRVHLVRVFTNLIDNAVQYTPHSREPRIWITARDMGKTWEITVGDNGGGIPPDARDKAFVMLQRLPSGKTLNPSGTGMGLAIVRRILEMNGGRCWIAESDERGTTMCLTFPKIASDHAENGKTPAAASEPGH